MISIAWSLITLECMSFVLTFNRELIFTKKKVQAIDTSLNDETCKSSVKRELVSFLALFPIEIHFIPSSNTKIERSWYLHRRQWMHIKHMKPARFDERRKVKWRLESFDAEIRFLLTFLSTKSINMALKNLSPSLHISQGRLSYIRCQFPRIWEIN